VSWFGFGASQVSRRAGSRSLSLEREGAMGEEEKGREKGGLEGGF